MIHILHLSDAHICEANLKDFSNVRQALFERIADQVASKQTKPDLVIFSGDLVQAGTRGSFEIGRREFLDPLLEKLQLSRECLLIVPGNHDIDRQVVRDDAILERAQKDGLANREELNLFVDKHLLANSHYHFSRLDNYFEFIGANSFAPVERRSPFFTTHNLKCKNMRIGVSCLNTSWRTSGEAQGDYGSLLLGERAVAESLGDIKNSDVKIAVMHHPTSWLRDFDEDECRPLLLKEFDLILTGHCHRARPQFVMTPTGRAVISEGGALYVSTNYFNGFCWITLDKPESVHFDLWRYEHQNAMRSFEPATNVATLGRYVVRLNTDEEVERFADVETTCKLLRPTIKRLADQHMLSNFAETHAPKSLEDLYVEIPVSGQSQYEPSKDSKPVLEAELLRYDRPVHIFGPRESGKTTLAFHLCVNAFKEVPTLIPVYLDLTRITAGANSILRAIRRFASDVAASVNFEAHLEAGNVVVVIDNFGDKENDGAARSRKIEMVDNFIKMYPKSKFVVVSNQDETTAAKVTKPVRLKTDHVTLYLHPLKRRGVRELTKRWLEPSGLYTQPNLAAVMSKLDAFNLPRTAHVVSMVLWTIERSKISGPINEATLLQRFVEANLEKFSPSEVDRGSIDFLIRETILSHLAMNMQRQGSTSLFKNDVVLFAIDFFRTRSWRNDASAFVDGLIASGVFVQFSDDEGVKLNFRFRCLEEYFRARFLQEDPNSLNDLMKGDGYLGFVREIDILTGLTRNNAFLLEALLDKAKDLESESKIDVSVRASIFASFKINQEETDQALIEFTSEIQEAGATDAEVHALLDDMDDNREGDHTKSPTVSSSGNGSAIPVAPVECLFLTTLLLSKVVRNNELVDNETLKLACVERVVRNWAYFAVEGIVLYEELADSKSTLEPAIAFAKLSVPERANVEIVLKCLFHAAVGRMAFEAIGSEKLLNIIDMAYDRTEQNDDFRRIVLLYVLLALGLSSATKVNGVTQKADLYIRNVQNRAVLIPLSMFLMSIYLDPFLGDENRRAIESMMVTLKLRAEGVGGKAAKSGRVRGLLLDKLKKIRSDTNRGEDD